PLPPSSHSFPTRRSSDLRWHESSWTVASTFSSSDRLSTIQTLPAESSRSIAYDFAALITKGRPYRSTSCCAVSLASRRAPATTRSEEHTSELQSRVDLVC